LAPRRDRLDLGDCRGEQVTAACPRAQSECELEAGGDCGIGEVVAG
jgi:hypothetical protein